MTNNRIEQLQQEIETLEAAKMKVLTTGQSYSLSGSHSVTRANIADLDAAILAKKKELSALILGHFDPIKRRGTRYV